MAMLSANELRKDEKRVEHFIRKLNDNTPFETKNGYVYIVPTDDIIAALTEASNSELNKYPLHDKDGNVYRLSDFVKNEEFGGKDTSEKEDIALVSLQKQIDLVKDITEKNIVPIQIKNNTYSVSGVVSTPGYFKSDFHLIDNYGKAVVYISHKDGTSPTGFRQWSGASYKNEPNIYNHEETKDFINAIKTKYPKGLPPATAISRKITDSNLKNISVYGNNYSDGYGPQNVNVVLQGSVNLVQKSPDVFSLDAHNIHYNGDIMTGGYEPSFRAQYTGCRNDYGLCNTRITITAIKGRWITEHI